MRPIRHMDYRLVFSLHTGHVSFPPYVLSVPSGRSPSGETDGSYPQTPSFRQIGRFPRAKNQCHSDAIADDGGDCKMLFTAYGACRQPIRELAAPDTSVLIGGPDGLQRRSTLEKLLT